jgi:Fic family protein
MSSQIEAERKDYYLKLETAQRGDLDITRWLAWFLDCLGRAIEGADETLAAVLYKAKMWQCINRRPVNDRQRLVINRLLNGFKGFLTTSKYARLAKCSTDTALRDIRELLERGILAQNPGGGRSTSYRLGDPDKVPTCRSPPPARNSGCSEKPVTVPGFRRLRLRPSQILRLAINKSMNART